MEKDKIPSVSMIARQKDLIVHYWEILLANQPGGDGSSKLEVQGSRKSALSGSEGNIRLKAAVKGKRRWCEIGIINMGSSGDRTQAGGVIF